MAKEERKGGGRPWGRAKDAAGARGEKGKAKEARSDARAAQAARLERAELQRMEREEAEAAEAAQTRTYVVKSGDSLSKIAKEVYGEAGRWPEIFEANKDKIKDPNLIYPGQELEIP